LNLGVLTDCISGLDLNEICSEKAPEDVGEANFEELGAGIVGENVT
jgi:hypothetical protein